MEIMKRIEKTFAELKKKGEKTLVAYITAGYPDLETTSRLIPALERAGVDILEVGVPFSDPTADGPVIQAASQAALKKGASLPRIVDLVGETRSSVGIPIVLFSYYNPIFSLGGETFARRAAAAGGDGVRVVDLPAEEAEELRRHTDPAGIDFISLVAPTTGADRVKKIVRASTGFVYYISVTGVTGTRGPEMEETHANVEAIRSLTKLPVVVGFGVSTPEQARRVGDMADGVVVGSAFVKLIGEGAGGPDLIASVGAYAASLKAALRRPASG
jgi:tryptophan synthase alpha chain